MNTPSMPAARTTAAPEPLPAPGRGLSIRTASVMAATAFAVIASLGALPSAAFAQAGQASDAPDNGALSQQELNRINNQPIAPTAKTELNHPRQPSFELNEADGTQVREYRDKRGQQADIEVRSSFGTKYQMSRPEDASPKIRDRENNRVPSVNILQF